MDSVFGSSLFAASWPLRQVMRLRRAWWPAPGLARALAPGETAATSQRVLPRLQFNLRGMTCLALAVGAVAGALSVTWVGVALKHDARLQALALAQRVERSLERFEDDLGGLLSGESLDELRCTPELVRHLTSRSLESALSRRFLVQRGGLACGPLGAEAAPLPGAMRPGVHLDLSSAGLPRLDARLWRDAQTLVRAEVDVVALQHLLRGSGGSEPAVAHQAWLKNDAGESLLALTQTAGTTETWVQMRTAVGAHPVHVEVQIDRGHFLREAGRQALRAVLLAWIVLGLLVLWAWWRTVSRARLAERVLRAVRKRQFEPFVQPVVDLATGQCMGGEILMRWQHPERGWLAPSEFIEEAERTGLIVPMTRLVMDKAAQRLAVLAQADRRLQFAFNVTPADLRSPGFAQALVETFHEHSLPQRQVVLELTEREFVGPRAASALAQLQAAGWRMAMDDFGTGHSSLAALERLQVHRIKIDRAFVATLDEHTVARPVLDAIIGLASSLGVPLIAEGVESEAQRQYLLGKGVQYAQGYLFARPMPIAEFERWWAQQQGDAATGASALAESSEALARALLQDLLGPQGVEQRRRWWRLRRYERCFVGSEAVQWLMSRRGMSREAAVQAGRRLLARGLIRHVLNEHDFEDAALFYRLVTPDDAAPALAPMPSALAEQLVAPDGPMRAICRRGAAMHRRCASGRAIVHWIAEQHRVESATARAWAQQLMRSGRLRHVFDDRPFTADWQLYRAQ